MPLPTERRGEGQTGVPVSVQGVPIHPGDWLVADADGIVVMRDPT
jgi:regulator of ribonuclease activity A